MSDSVSFDRAAAYYDETRGLSEEGVRRTTAVLSGLFSSAGRVLEVGVGTGQVSLPLHEAGVDLVGIDLAQPMLDALLEKAGGSSPFPLVRGDATRMPFRDRTFGGAFLRWVLHLIPDWRGAVREIARVLAPGAVFAASLGTYGGRRTEIQARFAEVTGVVIEPAGLGWDGWRALDEAIAALGGQKQTDRSFRDRDRDDLETFVRGIERNRYSWTWAVRDERVRAEAAADVRRWAEARYGPLDAVPRETFELRFARYRMP
jgi:ubiquinone/menaquinone biosynthesis C-methylase UbiE